MLPLARYAIFTATATKMTKITLLEMLDLTLQQSVTLKLGTLTSKRHF